MFGNHIGNAVFFEDGTGQNGGIVDAMGVNYVGFAVVGDIGFKSFHACINPTDAVDIDNRAAREEIHAVVGVSVESALLMAAQAVEAREDGFWMASQVAEHGHDHTDFHAFALQGLGLEAEKDSVHVGFGRRIPRGDNDNMHDVFFMEVDNGEAV